MRRRIRACLSNPREVETGERLRATNVAACPACPRARGVVASPAWLLQESVAEYWEYLESKCLAVDHEYLRVSSVAECLGCPGSRSAAAEVECLYEKSVAVGTACLGSESAVDSYRTGCSRPSP